ncbi:MAG: outer membrane protein assembly factor BamA [Lentisphaerae bacterium]|nr:outer membrane protein assembly factor BamA [Lentisphaerota bacterium]MCP4100198.1 outer membrane protein assembly factor BamA [Lentisphaerota bacterium]
MRQGILVITAFFAVMWSITTFAAEISNIDFKQVGGYKFPNKMLLYNVQQKPGKEYDKDVLRQDIKRLYTLGYFSDVVSEVRTTPDGKKAITVKLIVKSRVKAIVFKGNQKFKRKDLIEEVTLSPDMPLNDNKLRVSAERLRKYYKGKGFNDVQIVPVLKKVGKNQIDVVFNIKENLRLKVDNVRFEGVTVFSQWRLRGMLANRHSYLSRFLEYGLLQRDEMDNDRTRLRQLYWEYGYLDFKVEKVLVVQGKDDPEYVDITFKCYEGKPYKVGKISIAGNKIFKDSELLPLMTQRKGEVYNTDRAKRSSEAIQNAYESLGYADIGVREVRLPNFKTHIVDIEYVVNEGRKYTVKDVIISGNNITKDKVIRRELVIQPGDPLDKNRLKASKERLMGMGYFKKVEAVSVSSNEIGSKNVNFEVQEKKPFQFKVGGGFSSYYSLVGMAEITNNNFDLFDPENYFSGGGQRLRLQALVGLQRNSLNLNFVEPWLFDIPLRLAFDGYWNTVQYDFWDETRIGFRTTLSKKVLDDFTTASAGYKLENVNVSNIDSDRSQELRDQSGHQWVSQFSLLLNRDTRDSLSAPTNGYQLSTLGAISPRILGSSNNFYRLEAKGSYYFSLLEKALIFHLGGKVGQLSDFNRNNEAPLFERYFLGGGETIRGFPYRSIAPVDSNEDAIGGQSMLLLTATMTHPIYKFIRGAIFVDAGNVWANSYNFQLNKLNVGVGYGLRIKVPYLQAPIQLDLAYPVVNSVPGLSRKLRFHFNMGFTW